MQEEVAAMLGWFEAEAERVKCRAGRTYWPLDARSSVHDPRDRVLGLSFC